MNSAKCDGRTAAHLGEDGKGSLQMWTLSTALWTLTAAPRQDLESLHAWSSQSASMVPDPLRYIARQHRKPERSQEAWL